MRSNAIENLVQIGNLACSYGEAYEEEGQTDKGKEFRKFGIRVLMTSFEYSKNDKEIAEMIKTCAAQLNDEALSNWLSEKMRE